MPHDAEMIVAHFSFEREAVFVGQFLKKLTHYTPFAAMRLLQAPSNPREGFGKLRSFKIRHRVIGVGGGRFVCGVGHQKINCQRRAAS